MFEKYYVSFTLAESYFYATLQICAAILICFLKGVIHFYYYFIIYAFHS